MRPHFRRILSLSNGYLGLLPSPFNFEIGRRLKLCRLDAINLFLLAPGAFVFFLLLAFS